MQGGTATLDIPKLSALRSTFPGSWACAGSNSGPRMTLHWKIKFTSLHQSWDMPCHLQWLLITEVLNSLREESQQVGRSPQGKPALPQLPQDKTIFCFCRPKHCSGLPQDLGLALSISGFHHSPGALRTWICSWSPGTRLIFGLSLDPSSAFVYPGFGADPPLCQSQPRSILRPQGCIPVLSQDLN